MNPRFDAVVFDLGGVVFDSPVHALRRLESAHDVPPGAIGEMIRANGDAGAFAAVERGELDAAGFFAAFDRELRAAGLAVAARDVLAAIESVMVARPAMLERVRSLRADGYTVAALTNNARTSAEVGARFDDLMPHFDVFVESCVVGTRKPERRIYLELQRALDVAFESMVFLDDLGANLKTARALGMTTIKVDAEGPALAALDRVLKGEPPG